MKEHKNDIFQVLDRLTRKDYHLWETLSEEQQKEISPLIIMRWMFGTSSEYQQVLLNELVNTTIFSIPDHKELMLKLLAVCSDGVSKRYKWVNYKNRSVKKQKLATQLIATEYQISNEEAVDTLKLFSKEEVLELAERHGWQKDELTNLKKEL